MSSITHNSYTEGQKLWMVPRHRYMGEPREVTITKVGRKWLTLDNRHRAAVDGLTLDGGEYMSPGVCYLTRQEWEIEKTLLGNRWLRDSRRVFA